MRVTRQTEMGGTRRADKWRHCHLRDLESDTSWDLQQWQDALSSGGHSLHVGSFSATTFDFPAMGAKRVLVGFIQAGVS